MIGSRSAYTRKRILDAAGRLFAQKGDTGTSLREITAEARVNLSSVNYHFGSKEGLIRAVTQQRLDALTHEQLSMLDRLESRVGSGTAIKASDIVNAFFRPLIRHAITEAIGEHNFVPPHECARADANGLIRALIMSEHPEVMLRFGAALEKSLPHIPQHELLWRFRFMLGATSSAIAGMDGLLLALNQPDAEPFDMDRLIRRLMPLLVGGLLAPLPDDATPSPDGMPAMERRPGTAFHNAQDAQSQ